MPRDSSVINLAHYNSLNFFCHIFICGTINKLNIHQDFPFFGVLCLSGMDSKKKGSASVFSTPSMSSTRASNSAIPPSSSADTWSPRLPTLSPRRPRLPNPTLRKVARPAAMFKSTFDATVARREAAVFLKGRYQVYRPRCPRCGQELASEQGLQRHLQRARPCSAVVGDGLRVLAAESERRGVNINNSSIVLLEQYDKERRFTESIPESLARHIRKEAVKEEEEDLIYIDDD